MNAYRTTGKGEELVVGAPMCDRRKGRVIFCIQWLVTDRPKHGPPVRSPGLRSRAYEATVAAGDGAPCVPSSRGKAMLDARLELPPHESEVSTSSLLPFLFLRFPPDIKGLHTELHKPSSNCGSVFHHSMLRENGNGRMGLTSLDHEHVQDDVGLCWVSPTGLGGVLQSAANLSVQLERGRVSGDDLPAVVGDRIAHSLRGAPPNGSRLSCRLASRRKSSGRQSVPRQGHNTPFPLERSSPASFKRWLGGGLRLLGLTALARRRQQSRATRPAASCDQSCRIPPRGGDLRVREGARARPAHTTASRMPARRARPRCLCARSR